MLAHAFNPRTWTAEENGSLSLGPAQSREFQGRQAYILRPCLKTPKSKPINQPTNEQQLQQEQKQKQKKRERK